jgi:hypothetical protein
MKRFTETQKWEDPWFRRLSPELKLLWCWMLDKCDNAGVIEPDIELASFQIGYQYPMDTLSSLGSRLTDLGGGKYFIPKFINFQYGSLSRECKAHNPVFVSLEKHGLKGYGYPMDRVQEKEKEKDKEKDKDNAAPKPKRELKAQPIDDDYLAELQSKYPHAKVREQFANCTKWWLEKKKVHPSRRALVNWLDKVQPPPVASASMINSGLGDRCSVL